MQLGHTRKWQGVLIGKVFEAGVLRSCAMSLPRQETSSLIGTLMTEIVGTEDMVKTPGLDTCQKDRQTALTKEKVCSTWWPFGELTVLRMLSRSTESTTDGTVENASTRRVTRSSLGVTPFVDADAETPASPRSAWPGKPRQPLSDRTMSSAECRSVPNTQRKAWYSPREHLLQC